MKYLIICLMLITSVSCNKRETMIIKKSDVGRYQDGNAPKDISITGSDGVINSQNQNADSNDELDKMYQKMLEGNKLPSGAKHYKIAMPLPLSGNASPIGQAVLDGAKLALFDANINNVTLFPMDTNSVEMKTIASKIRDQNIDVVVGPIFAKETEELIDNFKFIGAPIVTMSNNYSLTKYPSVEVFGISPIEKASFAVNFARKSSRCNFALLLKSDVGASEIQNTITRAVRAQKCALLAVGFYDNSDVRIASAVNTLVKNKTVVFNIEKDGTPYLIDIKTTQKPNYMPSRKRQETRSIDVIITDAGGFTIDMLLSKMDDSDLLRRDIDIISLSDSIEVGILNDGVKYITYDRERFNIFSNSFNEMYQAKPSHFAALGYDAMGVLLNLFSTNNFSYDSLHASGGFTGVSGEFRFSPRRIVERKYSVYEVSKGNVLKVEIPS